MWSKIIYICIPVSALLITSLTINVRNRRYAPLTILPDILYFGVFLSLGVLALQSLRTSQNNENYTDLYSHRRCQARTVVIPIVLFSMANLLMWVRTVHNVCGLPCILGLTGPNNQVPLLVTSRERSTRYTYICICIHICIYRGAPSMGQVRHRTAWWLFKIVTEIFFWQCASG